MNAEEQFEYDVIFIGSGASSLPPSVLPAGQELTKAIITRLFESIDLPDKQFLTEHISNFCLENLMSQHPQVETCKQQIAPIFSRMGEINPVHHRIADLFAQNKISSIITTNYDCLIEKALRLKKVDFQVVSTCSDFSVLDRKPTIFKIHGCASRPDTIAITTRDEPELPVWKRSLLKKLLDGKRLLITCYSGLDFDICPELERCSPTIVDWNFLSPDHTTSKSSHLIKNTSLQAKYIFGSVTDLIGAGTLQHRNNTSDQQRALSKLIDAVFEGLTEKQVVFWQATTLETAQAPKALKEFLSGNRHILDDFQYFQLRAAEQFASGHRIRAARMLAKKARILSVSGEPLKAWELSSDALGAFTSAGDQKKAAQSMEFCIAIESKFPNLVRKHKRYPHHQWNVFAYLQNSKSRSKTELEQQYHRTKKVTLETGSWSDHAFLQSYAKKHQLDNLKGNNEPPAHFIFRDLGSFASEIDSILSLNHSSDAKLIRHINDSIFRARTLGLKETLWRLLLAKHQLEKSSKLTMLPEKLLKFCGVVALLLSVEHHISKRISIVRSAFSRIVL